MRNNDGTLSQFSIFHSFDPTSANRIEKKKGRRRRRRRRTVIIILLLLLLYYRRRRRENGRVGEAKGRQIARGMRRTLNCVSCVCILLRFYFISFHFFFTTSLRAPLKGQMHRSWALWAVKRSGSFFFSFFFLRKKEPSGFTHFAKRQSARQSARQAGRGLYKVSTFFPSLKTNKNLKIWIEKKKAKRLSHKLTTCMRWTTKTERERERECGTNRVTGAIDSLVKSLSSSAAAVITARWFFHGPPKEQEKRKNSFAKMFYIHRERLVLKIRN